MYCYSDCCSTNARYCNSLTFLTSAADDSDPIFLAGEARATTDRRQLRSTAATAAPGVYGGDWLVWRWFREITDTALVRINYGLGVEWISPNTKDGWTVKSS
jgi:hypothetical protein